jgi:hypothetical protein
VTAFLVTDGELAVECWEIDDLLPEDGKQQKRRQHSSKRAPRVMQMAVGSGEITGLDILVWPAPTSIYPPPSDYLHSNALDFTTSPS